MTQKRAFAANAKIGKKENNSWIITGGESIDSRENTLKLNSSEIFFNETFFSGPELPEAVSMHCMVQLNITHVVSTGGKGASSSAVKNAEILNSEMIWGCLPSMIVARFGHACGVYGNREIILVGGLNIKESEILSVILSEW